MIRIWEKKALNQQRKKKGIKKKKSSRRPVPTSNTAPVHRATGNFSPPPPRWAEELPPEPSRGGLRSTARAAVAVGTPRDETTQITAASCAHRVYPGYLIHPNEEIALPLLQFNGVFTKWSLIFEHLRKSFNDIITIRFTGTAEGSKQTKYNRSR